MNNKRFSRLVGNDVAASAAQTSDVALRGFTSNPLGGSVTPAQAQLYQAAFLQAQKELEEPEWPIAECWN